MSHGGIPQGGGYTIVEKICYQTEHDSRCAIGNNNAQTASSEWGTAYVYPSHSAALELRGIALFHFTVVMSYSQVDVEHHQHVFRIQDPCIAFISEIKSTLGILEH